MSNKKEDIIYKENLAKLLNDVSIMPSQPGVYLFLNEKSKILYIGKAKILKKRVSSYFQPGRDNRPQIPSLVSKIKKINYIITRNEREALILENNLIKQNHPYYNISLKDDKTYKSIKISTIHPYPGISIVRKYDLKDKNSYFGPYCNAEDSKIVFEQLQKIFQLRDCSDREFNKRKDVCMKYQIKLCSGSCCEKIKKDEYKNSVKDAISFLKGNDREVIKNLKNQIKFFSIKLQFEKSEQTLKKISTILKIRANQSVISGFKGDSDVIGYRLHDHDILFQIFIIRNGILISSKHMYFKEKYDELPDLLRLFLEQYYHEQKVIPSEIWLLNEPGDKMLLQDVLSERRGGKIKILVPKKGAKLKIVKLAMKNALLKLEKSYTLYSDIEDFAMEMKEKFHFRKKIYNIEAFDISHISGKDIVGAKVLYKDFKPFKNGYRKYIIKSVKKSDDYKSMYEVLKRRIIRGIKDKDLPDLFLIDGGLGQLSVLERVIKEYNIHLYALGIAKESHAKSSKDKLFVLGRKNSISLPQNCRIFLKLKEIRDEVHRFALTFHKLRRDKRIFKK
jgi:excinuclease ABC subunit C